MGTVTKFKIPRTEVDVERDRQLNVLKIIQKSVKRGLIKNMAIICENPSGQLYYTFHGTNAKVIISGLEILKTALIESMFK